MTSILGPFSLERVASAVEKVRQRLVRATRALGAARVPYAVVGVMPRGFHFLFETDLWALVDRTGPFDLTRDSHSHRLVGRLRAGVSVARAQVEMDLISAALRDEYPTTNATKGLWLGDVTYLSVVRFHYFSY